MDRTTRGSLFSRKEGRTERGRDGERGGRGRTSGGHGAARDVQRVTLVVRNAVLMGTPEWRQILVRPGVRLAAEELRLDELFLLRDALPYGAVRRALRRRSCGGTTPASATRP